MKARRPQNPILNNEDLLEIESIRAKFEKRDMDSIHEESEEDELMVSHEEQSLDGNHSWACQACTFLNNDLLQQCEVCDTNRHGIVKDHSEQPSHSVEPPSLNECNDWPSLEEACMNVFICDVSSIASSWVEVPCIDESDEDVEDFIVVSDVPSTKIKAEEKCVSWSARVASVASIGDAPKLPVAGVLMPPLSKKHDVQKRRKEDNEMMESCDWDLEDLEVRRLRPHMLRGATQRFRLRKR
jgi:hypothetical protein